MTDLQAIKLTAQISQPGTRVRGYGGQVMVVTGVNNYGVTGYSEYVYRKYNKKNEMVLPYDNILNPHTNKNISIVKELVG